MRNPIRDLHLTPADLTFVGAGLHRPECVVPMADGTVYCSDKDGIMRIDPGGGQTLIRRHYPDLEARDPERAARLVEASETNGFWPAPDGRGFLVANIGGGCVERIGPGGATEILCDSIDGAPLGAVNYVTADARGRIWFTVSTRVTPWHRTLNAPRDDGIVGVIDERGARIVADGVRFCNECRLDANEEFLYLAETFGRRILRFRVGADASLTQREVYGPSRLSGFPDGICLDAHANLWIAIIVMERVVAITPQGDEITVLDLAADRPEPGPRFMAQWERGEATLEDLVGTASPAAPLVASVNFGRRDPARAYLGSLLGTRLATFTVAGVSRGQTP